MVRALSSPGIAAVRRQQLSGWQILTNEVKELLPPSPRRVQGATRGVERPCPLEGAQPRGQPGELGCGSWQGAA